MLWTWQGCYINEPKKWIIVDWLFCWFWFPNVSPCNITHDVKWFEDSGTFQSSCANFRSTFFIQKSTYKCWVTHIQEQEDWVVYYSFRWIKGGNWTHNAVCCIMVRHETDPNEERQIGCIAFVEIITMCGTLAVGYMCIVTVQPTIESFLYMYHFQRPNWSQFTHIKRCF